MTTESFEDLLARRHKLEEKIFGDALEMLRGKLDRYHVRTPHTPGKERPQYWSLTIWTGKMMTSIAGISGCREAHQKDVCDYIRVLANLLDRCAP